jgi:hypothetical protein
MHCFDQTVMEPRFEGCGEKVQVFVFTLCTRIWMKASRDWESAHNLA